MRDDDFERDVGLFVDVLERDRVAREFYLRNTAYYPRGDKEGGCPRQHTDGIDDDVYYYNC